MPSTGFEPAIPVIKRPQTYALESTAIGIGTQYYWFVEIKVDGGRGGGRDAVSMDDIELVSL